MNSENHLVLISPRRFGKSSLIAKALKEIDRPNLTLNLQRVISVEDFSSKLLREVFECRNTGVLLRIFDEKLK